MKRRNFFKASIFAGAGLAFSGAMQGCNQSNKLKNKAKQVTYLPTPQKPYSLQKLENENLKFDLKSDASAEITDKKNNYTWNIGKIAIQDYGKIEEDIVWTRCDRKYMEQYPASFVAELTGDVIKITVLGRQNRFVGSFKCRFGLDKEWLTFSIISIDEDIPSLMFPPPIISEKVIVPHGPGSLFHKPTGNIWDRYLYLMHTGLNMNCFAGLKDDHAWLAIFDENIADCGVMRNNSSLYPCWLRSMDTWNSTFSLRYKFIKGGYVEVAKHYKKYLQDKGFFKTIEEKTKENPKLNNLLGGRSLCYFQAFPGNRFQEMENLMFSEEHAKKQDENLSVNFTHAQVKESLEYAKKKGFSKGMLLLRGWCANGYDGLHPDVWPPEKKLGTVEQLQETLKDEDMITSCLHDNYQDIYQSSPSFPKGVIQRPGGELLAGGFWAGGQAYILNSRDSLAYLKRNWENIKQLKPNAIFCDTLTASKLLQSHESGNELNKLEDLQLKTEILKFYKQQNILVGSEEGAWFGIPYCDWYETRHHRTIGETIPFWQLVFHDAVYTSRYNSFDPNSAYPNKLEDLLWGNFLQYFMSPVFGNINEKAPQSYMGFGPNNMSEELFVNNFDVDKWHERIGKAEMTGHRFLSDDFQVEETSWSTGDRIIVNFSNSNRIIEGQNIPKFGYRIINT